MDVVFKGRVLHIENPNGWDESVIIAVDEYYKGEGRSVIRVVNVSAVRLCHGFVVNVGTEAIFYVHQRDVQPVEYLPGWVLRIPPENTPGRSPSGLDVTFGLAESAVLGFSRAGWGRRAGAHDAPAQLANRAEPNRGDERFISMRLKTLFLIPVIVLSGLLIPPRVDACTQPPPPYPTATYTPTSTATDVPPGVTPAPS